MWKNDKHIFQRLKVSRGCAVSETITKQLPSVHSGISAERSQLSVSVLSAIQLADTLYFIVKWSKKWQRWRASSASMQTSSYHPYPSESTGMTIHSCVETLGKEGLDMQAKYTAITYPVPYIIWINAQQINAHVTVLKKTGDFISPVATYIERRGANVWFRSEAAPSANVKDGWKSSE